MVRSSLLFNFNYNNLSISKEAIAEAVNYGLIVSKNEPKFANWHLSCGSEKLRVGFVSGDFYNHPVGYFLEGLVEKLDSSSFELFAFPSLIVNDDLTNRIIPFF